MYATLFIACLRSGNHAASDLAQTDTLVRSSAKAAECENMSHSLSSRVTFGPFCLTSSERRITRDGVPIEIGGRSLDLLIALVDEPGRVLSKHELQKRVWANVIVEDSSLRFHMANLRKILRDGEDGARYISTQVGVGYAFVAQVHRVPIADSGSSQASFVREPKVKCEEPDVAVAKLPTRSPHVIGRERDVRLLSERVAQTQLFTIVGPAGVGKTTLAVEIGHVCGTHFAGNRSFVDLGRLAGSGPGAIGDCRSAGNSSAGR